MNEKGKSRDSPSSDPSSCIDRVVLNLRWCFPNYSQHSMKAAKRAKLEIPVSEMNGKHHVNNGVEHKTDTGALSPRQIMALREAHIG